MEREIFTAEFCREGGEGFLIQGNVTLRYSFQGLCPAGKGGKSLILKGNRIALMIGQDLLKAL